MKKTLILGAALLAGVAFAPADASAKNVKNHGMGWGYSHHAMPSRSNKGGKLRGHDRARQVHYMNDMKRYR